MSPEKHYLWRIYSRTVIFYLLKQYKTNPNLGFSDCDNYGTQTVNGRTIIFVNNNSHSIISFNVCFPRVLFQISLLPFSRTAIENPCNFRSSTVDARTPPPPSGSPSVYSFKQIQYHHIYALSLAASRMIYDSGHVGMKDVSDLLA